MRASALILIATFWLGCDFAESTYPDDRPPMSEMSETEQPTPEDLQDCGGCSLPPLCNEDGSAPVPYPPCSCGCNEGVELAGGVCNENGCIVPNGSTGE